MRLSHSSITLFLLLPCVVAIYIPAGVINANEPSETLSSQNPSISTDASPVQTTAGYPASQANTFSPSGWTVGNPSASAGTSPEQTRTPGRVPTTAFPLPNPSDNIKTHDPSIIYFRGHYYLFTTTHITIRRAVSLSGPWVDWGSVLDKNSIIDKPGNDKPWSPSVFQWGDKIYCLYSVSQSGSKNSAIGVAWTTANGQEIPKDQAWTDHGAIIETGSGPGSDLDPFKESNAIDPAFIVDVKTKQPYLVYGSFWTNIWQIPLKQDLSRVIADIGKPDLGATQLIYQPQAEKTGQRPVEGAFLTYRAPYYYAWFSHGICCEFASGRFPPVGKEYVQLPFFFFFFFFPLISPRSV